MPSNTGYNPLNIKDFEKSKLNKVAIGINGIAVAGEITNIDYTLTDDSLISKGYLLINGAAQGDTITLQVIHPVYGIILQPITSWYVDWTELKQEVPESNYPAKAFAGLIIRLVYHSVGANNIWIAFNLDKEKVLE